MHQPPAFVEWFRSSSPYIHAHRGHTCVVFFGGEAVEDPGFPNLVHDLALLNGLGIRLVLVHGIRPQVDKNLRRIGIDPKFHAGLRVTDDIALECVKEAAGRVRVEIEALLSCGMANSPMAGAKLRVVSGNFVSAKPLGVIDAVDYGHTGAVRRIDRDGVAAQLQQNHIVLLSAIGFSPSGEAFNLSAEQVATEAAITLQADKLILLTEDALHRPGDGELIKHMTVAEAETLLGQQDFSGPLAKQQLQAAIRACQCGVGRVHLVGRKFDGALLLELFTRDGLGTLVSSTPFETLRRAIPADIAGILELVAPLERQGILKKRPRERLEMEIDDYFVIDCDGQVIGCAALHTFAGHTCGEIACLAVHPDYRNGTHGSRLLQYVFDMAKSKGVETVYALSTQTAHWFLERGFLPVAIADLPPPLQQRFVPERNSKALRKAVR